MKKQILTTFVLAALTSTALAARVAPKMSPYGEKEGTAVKLDFDPIYCDENEDGQLQASEIRPDNLCLKSRQDELDMFKSNSTFATSGIGASNYGKTFGLAHGQLALTIDDGPSKVTPLILDLLKSYGIKATFFSVGNQVKQYPQFTRRVVAEGHTLANHSRDHDVAHITASTIVAEVRDADAAFTAALGHPIEGRRLFRAPGLGWNAAKAAAVNADSMTRNYIGPIHANLGTDQPRADWYCWGHAVSADTCANFYFEDIMKAGRGIILNHDIYYKNGSTLNTFELLTRLLARLEANGGIKNNPKHKGVGAWEFVLIVDSPALDQYDTHVFSKANQAAPAVVAAPVAAPSTVSAQASGGGRVVTNFPKGGVSLRSADVLVRENHKTPASVVVVNGDTMLTGHIKKAVELDKTVTIDGAEFKLIRVVEAIPGFEALAGQTVWAWSGAF